MTLLELLLVVAGVSYCLGILTCLALFWAGTNKEETHR